MGHQNLVVALKERVIFLDGDITSQLANRFEIALKRLAASGKDSVRCYICSPGGDLGAGLRMMQLVTRAPFPVDFVAYERVASAALVLMQSGREAYAAGPAIFGFHRTHERYRLADKTDVGVDIGWEDSLQDMWSLVVCDTIILQWFLRRCDPRMVIPLFQMEADISARQAKKIGLIVGYLSPAQVRADQAAIRKLVQAHNGSRK